MSRNGHRHIVSANRLVKHYKVGDQVVSALAGIDLHVAKGEFVAIVGPSGSGKSTLLNVLGCLDRPDEGGYVLDGTDVSSLDDERASSFRSRKIGFVFQSFHLLPRLSVIENVLLPLRFARIVDKSEVDVITLRAETILGRMGLQKYLNHRPNQLSGGQMQRAAIARALVMDPALVLADEPTGNLDSRSAAEVLDLIEEVNASGQTVIMVTHDMEVADNAARRVGIRDGRVEFDKSK